MPDEIVIGPMRIKKRRLDDSETTDNQRHTFWKLAIISCWPGPMGSTA
jgi:hypothetical protein